MALISDPGKPASETGAIVSIEASPGGSQFLSEQDSGRYTVTGLAIDRNAFYSLRIRTRAGTEYVSDTVRVRDTPPIDSLSFGISNDGEGLEILVSTHDPTGKTWYYSWDYIETYEYRSVFYSGYKRVNGIPRTRFRSCRLP